MLFFPPFHSGAGAWEESFNKSIKSTPPFHRGSPCPMMIFSTPSMTPFYTLIRNTDWTKTDETCAEVHRQPSCSCCRTAKVKNPTPSLNAVSEMLSQSLATLWTGLASIYTTDDTSRTRLFTQSWSRSLSYYWKQKYLWNGYLNLCKTPNGAFQDF